LIRLIFALLVLLSTGSNAAAENQLRFLLRSDPKTLDPLRVEDDSSELIRFLTGGVLIRVNRVTQDLQPELATSWKMSRDGKKLTLQLRKNVRFSDGSPFDSADVVHTFRLLMAPQLHSATADSFRSGDAAPVVNANGPAEVSISFPAPLASAARLLDQVAILSSNAESGKSPVLGPFVIAERKPGAYILLQRNPNYWKHDAAGRAMPYLNSVRIGIQTNRELEALAFRRGEIDLINSLDARTFEQLAKSLPKQVIDIGPALDSEFLWFNQVPSAKIAESKKVWFRSAAFRRAVSMAINRADLCRIAYRGHAIPAVGPYPPANKVFFNSALKQRSVDIPKAKKILESAGFSNRDGTLRDSQGNAVAFTVITNAGNRTREQLAALIQRDLKALGIQMNIVTLDFPALIERMVKTYEYDACLLGLVNIDPDPNGQMNVWLSSGANHQWNPKQAKPATQWEAEIDKLMRSQASATTEAQRTAAFNRVQEILYEQEPFIYLVHPNALAAVSTRVKNVQPSTLQPRLLWNIEFLDLVPGKR